MYKLNLPDFDYKLKKAEGKVWIFDGIRKKYIVLTPEEWVRQHFIHYLIQEKRYPKFTVEVVFPTPPLFWQMEITLFLILFE